MKLESNQRPIGRRLADAILDCSAPGDIVLDSFVGSGSTLIAAAIRRWQTHTGEHAVHSQSSKRIYEVATNRLEAACG